jgi:general secretion pathway protein D
MTTHKKSISCVLLISLSLSGCEALKPFTVDKLALTPVISEQQEQQDAAFKQLQNSPTATKTKTTTTELYPGTDRFVPETITQHRAVTPTGTGTYSLNFDDADLGEVAKVILSDILGQNYVLSPKVAGKVTLQTTEALTKEELIPTLEMVLRMNNAALVKDSRIYHIEPVAEALFVSNTTSSKIGYQTRVIPVRNVAVQEVADIIKPLVQEKTILNINESRNILVASGTADEIARVVDLVSTFDIDLLKGRSFGLFSLAHVDPETVIKELEGIFQHKSKDDESSFFQFMPIQRLNAVLAVTHQGRYLKDIESWVLRLDRANSSSGGGGVNVYKVQHANAEELANTLNEIFTSAQNKSSSAKVTPGQTAASITNKSPTDTPTPETSAPKKSTANTNSSAATGTAKVSSVDNVKIIADKANNAVVVVATAQEYAVIRPIIEQLDIVPLQVLIDATIASVNLTDDLKYGIAWYLNKGSSAISNGLSGTQLGNIAYSATSAYATGGLSAVYNSGAVNAVLSAQADKGNLNVISSPSLMVLNNQKAKINVGDQVPIQTSTSSLPVASGSSPTIALGSSIQYKDTGVTLEVTPRVNANGMVIMDIKQVFSVPVLTTTGVSTSPTIQKKEIESSIAVNDGETIVLGGLIDDTNNASKSGIPLLYDLPWIGSIFGNTTYKRTKNELVILITPRVVKSKQDSRLISDEFKRKLTGIYQKAWQNDNDSSSETGKNLH